MLLLFFSAAVLCTNALAVDAPLYSEFDNVIVHSSDSMQEYVLAGDQFWIVEVFANWCDACKMASADVKTAASTLLKEGIPFGAINIDDDAAGHAHAFGVTHMPTFLAFHPALNENKQPEIFDGKDGAWANGAEAIMAFARAQFKKLSADEQMAHRESLGLPDSDYSVTDPKADHFAAAVALDDFGSKAGALASFRAAAKFAPSETNNWHNLGLALLAGSNMREDAIESFEKALIVDPTNTDAAEELARIRGLNEPTHTIERDTIAAKTSTLAPASTSKATSAASAANAGEGVCKTASDVAQWVLTVNGIPVEVAKKYAAAFIENDVDNDTMDELANAKDDMSEIVDNAIHRGKLASKWKRKRSSERGVRP